MAQGVALDYFPSKGAFPIGSYQPHPNSICTLDIAPRAGFGEPVPNIYTSLSSYLFSLDPSKASWQQLQTHG